MIRPIGTIHAVALAAMVSTGRPLVAQEAGGEVPRIAVEGVGRVATVPDMANLSLGVVAEADTPGAAVSALSADLDPLLAALTGMGIAPSDIQTGRLSLSPVYADGPRDGGEAPRIAGYSAESDVNVRLGDVARLGDVLDAAVGAGSNRFGGVSFGLSDPQPAEDAALAGAMADAMRKAAILSEAAGLALGDVISIDETGRSSSPGPVMMRMDAAEGGVPTAPGEVETVVTIQAVFGLE